MFTLSPIDLAEIIRWHAKIVGKDNLLPALRTVHLTVRGDELHGLSTDRYRILMTRHQIDGSGDLDVQVRPDDLQRAVPLLAPVSRRQSPSGAPCRVGLEQDDKDIVLSQEQGNFRTPGAKIRIGGYTGGITNLSEIVARALAARPEKPSEVSFSLPYLGDLPKPTLRGDDGVTMIPAVPGKPAAFVGERWICVIMGRRPLAVDPRVPAWQSLLDGLLPVPETVAEPAPEPSPADPDKAAEVAA